MGLKLNRNVLIGIASGLFVGWILGRWSGEEWKPVGNGFSIVNSRTGEVKSARSNLPSLAAISGEWINEKEWNETKVLDLNRILEIGQSSVTKNRVVYTAQVADYNSVSKGNQWWVVSLATGSHKVNWRLELIEHNGSKLLLVNGVAFITLNSVIGKPEKMPTTQQSIF